MTKLKEIQKAKVDWFKAECFFPLKPEKSSKNEEIVLEELSSERQLNQLDQNVQKERKEAEGDIKSKGTPLRNFSCFFLKL